MASILVTSAIAPPQGVPALRLQDAHLRLIATRSALYRWADSRQVGKMVICDGSGVQPLTPAECELFAHAGVEVEQLCFAQDQAVLRARGKGFGEGLLIDHALRHSAILGREAGFYKVTAKMYCHNFAEICALVDENPVAALFWRFNTMALPQCIDMRFYYCGIDWFNQVGRQAYQAVDESAGRIIESTMLPLLERECRMVHVPAPRLSGRVGGSDRYFDDLAAPDLGLPAFCALLPGSPE